MKKRFFDLVASSIGLFGCLPVMGLIALAIKWEDGGPILYRGRRVGRHGKTFYIYKFRTMVVDAEKKGGPSTAGDDPRLTKAGRLLRKYKLDELSQLMNVVKGEMSLVGPRPEVQHYVDLFTEEEQVILSVRPGITDWASIWNSDEGAVLAGSDDPEKKYMETIRPTKIKLQLEYVKNRSFFTDLHILFLTTRAMLTGQSRLPGSLREVAPDLI